MGTFYLLSLIIYCYIFIYDDNEYAVEIIRITGVLNFILDFFT